MGIMIVYKYYNSATPIVSYTLPGTGNAAKYSCFIQDGTKTILDLTIISFVAICHKNVHPSASLRA